MRFLLLALLFLLFAGCGEQKEIGYQKILVFFSPNGGAEKGVIKVINNAHREIVVAMFSFTNKNIARALVNARKRGVNVRVILDRRSSKRSVAWFLTEKGISVRVKEGSGGGLMHNKYAVVDGKYVITGSFNWTVSAERRNDENLLIIHSPELARVYKENFEKLWARSYSIH